MEPETMVSRLLDVLKEVESMVGLGNSNAKPDAAREFALAKTYIEDAVMRVNRGMAKLRGTFYVSDVERESPDTEAKNDRSPDE